MRQLEAFKVFGPFGPAYIVEQEDGDVKLFHTVEEFIESYSPNLLNILQEKGRYESPKEDKNQLSFDF